MRSFFGLGLVAGFAVLAATTLGGASGQARSQPGGITMIKPAMEFPAIGNIDAVKQWRVGRIERIERRTGTDDVAIDIRTADEQVHRVIGPREPLAFLVRRCGWVSSSTQTFASRSDYVERMVAFDVDSNGRIIAVMSLEPFARSTSRMRRAFCGR